ncbi:MAG: hypothetical protein RIF41_35790 [Polyangiaceae bacterium]
MASAAGDGLDIFHAGDGHRNVAVDQAAVAELAMGVVAPLVHVDGARGDDAADGATWATAKETVWAGIAAAATTGCPLWIAEGTYLGLLMALRIHAAAQTKGDEAAA